MRRVTALLIGLTLTAGCGMPEPIRVMSFNIRYANPGDGINRWENRREAVVQRILAFDPDVVGLQEVLHDQAVYLREALPDYDFIGVGRDDGKTGGEMVPILFRRSSMRLTGRGHVWLSDEPGRPGSIGWDAECPRMITWVRLQFKKSPLNSVTVLNTHFDHRGKRARFESAKVLRMWADSQGGKPLIVLGDFNATPESQVHRALTEDTGNLAQLRDTYQWLSLPEESGGTFNGWEARATGPRIDWILSNRRLEIEHADVDRDFQPPHPPSDHFPVTAILRLIPLTRTGVL